MTPLCNDVLVSLSGRSARKGGGPGARGGVVHACENSRTAPAAPRPSSRPFLVDASVALKHGSCFTRYRRQRRARPDDVGTGRQAGRSLARRPLMRSRAAQASGPLDRTHERPERRRQRALRSLFVVPPCLPELDVDLPSLPVRPLAPRLSDDPLPATRRSETSACSRKPSSSALPPATFEPHAAHAPSRSPPFPTPTGPLAQPSSPPARSLPLNTHRPAPLGQQQHDTHDGPACPPARHGARRRARVADAALGRRASSASSSSSSLAQQLEGP